MISRRRPRAATVSRQSSAQIWCETIAAASLMLVEQPPDLG